MTHDDWRTYQALTFPIRFGYFSKPLYDLRLFGKVYTVWSQRGRKPVLLLAERPK